MKKRMIAFVLVGLLCFGVISAQAQTTPFAQILSGKAEQQTLSLTLRVGQAGEFTCLVYAAKENGEQGELLQVAQWQVQQAGIFTKDFAVTPCATGYVVHFGGSEVDVPKTVFLKGMYLSSALRIEGEETTETLPQKATHLKDIEITRGEHTVTPGDVVLPGDKITALYGEHPYIGYAVVAGDLDLNGGVNAKDALLVLRYAVGKITLTDAAFAAADFKQNGKIDAVSALNILKFSVGKLKSL